MTLRKEIKELIVEHSSEKDTNIYPEIQDAYVIEILKLVEKRIDEYIQNADGVDKQEYLGQMKEEVLK